MTPWIATCQALLSMGFPRQEYWSGSPRPPPEDLPDPGIEPVSPASSALADRFFTTEPPGSPYNHTHTCKHKLRLQVCTYACWSTHQHTCTQKPVFFCRTCVQGNQFNTEVSRSDKLSLPGFENLTAGYNKFLRPNFGGRSFFLPRTSIQKEQDQR